MNGEVYVKASSLVSQLGGKGSYDAASGTYAYQPVNEVAQAVEKTSASVVAIIGRYSNDASSGIKGSEDRFQLAHGTGVVWKSDGWIITNAHVVKDLKNMVVVTYDGKQYTGTAKYTDEESDLALVKIEAKNLSPAKFADNMNVQVGETVVAIGTPISFALRNSVTVGVVSGIDRSVHSTYRLLQTDAAINPGNSGGALLNLRGEVIGINSLKFAAVGVESLGFSIPSDTVMYVMDQFMKYGKVKRPYLGFTVEESWAALVGLPTDDPLKISYVNDKAAAAGIHKGDVLYSIDDVNVKTLVDLNERLKAYLPGDKVKLMLQSDGDLVQKEITLTEEN
ncbi:trypsin-like peptidase domain-containing protein [Paenibacillus athensensis]|uniref:Trypsin n=1 Tax=Paenibacillus athensensis TaxID=1967502 RepID=A0A4Y8Q2M7_9BACL|nr:trypsin-like peptidase domain-containing protein [Paenibacillus athensensis]